MRATFGNFAVPIAIAILVLWGVGTFYFEPPGWFHGLLTGGVFLLIWGIIRKPAAERKTTGTRR